MLYSLLLSGFLTWKTFCVSSRWPNSHPGEKAPMLYTLLHWLETDSSTLTTEGCRTARVRCWSSVLPKQELVVLLAAATGRIWRGWPVQEFLYWAAREVTFSSFPAAFHRAKLWTSQRSWLTWGRWKTQWHGCLYDRPSGDCSTKCLTHTAETSLSDKCHWNKKPGTRQRTKGKNPTTYQWQLDICHRISGYHHWVSLCCL